MKSVIYCHAFLIINDIYRENDYTMKNNKYQEEFSNYINIMSEALKREDYKAYEYEYSGLVFQPLTDNF